MRCSNCNSAVIDSGTLGLNSALLLSFMSSSVDPNVNRLLTDKSTQKKLALDAMYKLEHGVEDKVKVKQAIPGLGQLEQVQALKKDDYLLNKLARQKFRVRVAAHIPVDLS